MPHESDYADPGRRRDDPYRELNDRLSALETGFSGLRTELNTIKLEQTHMSALFASRFSTLEKAQELTIAEVRSLNSSIRDMAGEADKSPAGRALLAAMKDHEDDAESRNDAIQDIRHALMEHERKWQNLNGVLMVLKATGLSGVGALIWVALRTFGKVP